MKISANEFLLLNKVKFGEDPEGSSTTVSAPIPQPSAASQSGMNALMFQGLNNLAGNPQFAANYGAMQTAAMPFANDDINDGSDNSKIPFQSNIAFQGSFASKAKTALIGTVIALSTLGGLTSCEDEDPSIVDNSTITINQTVNFNYSNDESKWDALYELMSSYMEQQSEQNSELNSLLTEILGYLSGMMSTMEGLGTDLEYYYGQIFEYLTASNENQQIIIDLLTQNGKTEEEAVALLNQLLEEVENGNMTAAEAMAELLNVIYDISDSLAKVVALLEQAEADREELISIANQILESSNTTNSQLEELIAQGEVLIASNEAANAKLDSIAAKIEELDLDLNAGFEEVAEAIGMSTSSLLNTMIQLGYTQAQVEAMTAAQILAAIKENTEATNEINEKLAEILAAVEAGNISAAKAAEQIIALLGDISDKLDAVLSALEEAAADREELISIATEIKNATYVTNSKLNKLISQGEILIESNAAVIETLESIEDAIEQANIDSNANFETLIETLNMTKSQIIEVMVQLGYTQAQVEAMTAAQILAAIKENTEATNEINEKLAEILAAVEAGNISAAEAAEQIIELLGAISSQLNAIITSLQEHYGDDSDVETYLAAILAAVEANNDKADATNELLEEIYTYLESLGTKGDAFGKQLLSLIANIGVNISSKLSAVMKAINDSSQAQSQYIQSLLEKIIENQNSNTEAIIEAIGNIEVSSGDIDLSSLETMIEELISLAKSNNTLLSDISAKTDVLNLSVQAVLDAMEAEYGENSERYAGMYALLEKLIAKVEAGTYDDTELLDKLDSILEAINDHDITITVDTTGTVTCECDCSCGASDSTHEGILEDLEDILS